MQIWAIFIILIIIFVLSYFLLQKLKSIQKARYQAKFPHSYECLDGHKARSLSEVLIDNCLFRHGIRHQDEDYIEKNAEKKYKYDFYLQDCDVYLEFFGYSGKKYYETKELKEKFYKKYRKTMIAIDPMDLVNVDKSLQEKLNQYWNAITVNKHCPNCGADLGDRI